MSERINPARTVTEHKGDNALCEKVYGTCKKLNKKNALLAQLDRALVYGTKGWGFELLMVHQKKTR